MKVFSIKATLIFVIFYTLIPIQGNAQERETQFTVDSYLNINRENVGIINYHKQYGCFYFRGKCSTEDYGGKA